MTEADPPGITFEIVTLFPELFDGLLGATVVGKAVAAGVVAVHRTNPRDFAPGRYRQVDDTPYGGGPGMVMRVEPIAAALQAIATARGPSHRILLTPRGRLFDQAAARALARRPRLTLVCGRYEGMDERVSSLVDEELRLGDFVLAGGELAAAAVLEATARLCPGVLGCGGAPRASAVDPPGGLERAGGSRGAAFRGPRGDRALAPPGGGAADPGAPPRSAGRPPPHGRGETAARRARHLTRARRPFRYTAFP
jgi:tRNA (guanine37-N1)-methyltransferase